MKLAKPKKNLGQHFLTGSSIARQIIDTVDACPDVPVLEIEPGMSILTQYLVEKPYEVKAAEIDSESVAFLYEKSPKLCESILGQDFPRMGLNGVFNDRQFVLTGNYPYDIPSQTFLKMLEYRGLIPCCTGMIQREVAQRTIAGPGSKTYDILSILIQAWYDIEYLSIVDESAFNPPLKVKNAVIRMARNEMTDTGCDRVFSERVVKTVFSQHRKMLQVSLRQIFSVVKPTGGFYEQDIMTKRPEQLSIAQFVELVNMVEKRLKITGR